MKVIAKKTEKIYICEIHHIEIEKILNLYSSQTSLKKLSVGEAIDLGKGHDFFQDIQEALRKTREFFKSHESTVKAIANGFLLTAINEPEKLDLTLGE